MKRQYDTGLSPAGAETPEAAWLDAVLREVRFWPDRKRIRQELQEHMEDAAEALAEAKAAEAAGIAALMGDPVAVGRQLNRQHSPVLGWLWAGSWLLLAVLFIAVAVLGVRAWAAGQALQARSQYIDFEAERQTAIQQGTQTQGQPSQGTQGQGQPFRDLELDYSVTISRTKLSFTDVLYSLNESGTADLCLLAGASGPYSFSEGAKAINCNGCGWSHTGYREGEDSIGQSAGFYQIFFEDVPWQEGRLEFSYDRLGETFGFTVDVTAGEVYPDE